MNGLTNIGAKFTNQSELKSGQNPSKKELYQKWIPVPDKLAFTIRINRPVLMKLSRNSTTNICEVCSEAFSNLTNLYISSLADCFMMTLNKMIKRGIINFKSFTYQVSMR